MSEHTLQCDINFPGNVEICRLPIRSNIPIRNLQLHDLLPTLHRPEVHYRNDETNIVYDIHSAKRMFDAVNHPNLKVMVDNIATGNAYVPDPFRTFQTNLPMSLRALSAWREVMDCQR